MSVEKEKPEAQKKPAIADVAMFICMIVICLSGLSFMLAFESRDWTGVGTCLIAASLSAGFLLNATMRK